MNNDDVYQQSQDCLLEDMDGELLLFDPSSAVTLHLNGPSGVVWQLIDGKRSCADIVSLVQESYPEQAEQIPTDIASVIVDLAERKVISLAQV